MGLGIRNKFVAMLVIRYVDKNKNWKFIICISVKKLILKILDSEIERGPSS